MAEDIREGFKESKLRVKAINKYNKVKTDYTNFTQTFPDKLQKKSDSIQLNLDSAALSRKIKNKTSNSYEELIDLIGQTRNGVTTIFFIKILKNQLQNLQSLIEIILLESMISALGCSQEEVYQTNQELYINVENIDLFKQLKLNPDSVIGASIYEKNQYDPTLIPRATNRFFYDLIQTPSVQQSYFGTSGQELFRVSFETFNGVTQGSYFKIILLNRVNAPNRVTDFIIDYFKTLKLFDYNNAITKILDMFLNMYSANANSGPSNLNDNKRFIKILQRILGLCFDYNQEIDVGGISKYPEFDDVSDTFFEFTPNQLSEIENEISIIRRGYVEFIDCNNLELPITDINYVFDTISEVNENGSNMDVIMQEVYFNLSNDNRWQLQALPSSSFNKGIIDNFLTGAVQAILSPKVIFPFITMSKALSSTVSNLDDNIINDVEAQSPGLMAFAKTNRRFIIDVTSKISGLFIEALFNQLKQDILVLVKQTIRELIVEKGKMSKYAIGSIIDTVEELNNIGKTAKGVVNLIQDFRSCKSLINQILNLLKLTLPPKKYILPTPFLYLTEYLSGVLPQKEVVEYILQMERIGVKTGPGINGEPDYGTMEKIAVFTASFNERAKNGKVEGVIVAETIPPTGQLTGNVRVTGKYF